MPGKHLICSPIFLYSAVSADKSETGMASQPLDIVCDLRLNVFPEILIQFIYIICEHKILPYDDPVFIAQIVESVRRIIASSPDS